MANEFELIQRLEQSAPPLRADIDLGIGDDCAVWTVGTQQVLLATDLLVENVHFDLEKMSFAEVGRKALAVNLSDIAAMAGSPATIMVSLVVNSVQTLNNIEELMSGLAGLAEEYEMSLVGGDTTSHAGPLMINVAVTGLSQFRGPVLRSGAKRHDRIFVTGLLGGSIHSHHWSFTPRVAEARFLHQHYRLNSMIDLSDGLASDIRHIANASKVGCIIHADQLPISDDVDSHLSRDERVHRALTDGEDFELLLTVSPVDAEKMRSQTEVSVHEIGEIKGDPSEIDLLQPDGTVVPIPDSGWKHRFA